MKKLIGAALFTAVLVVPVSPAQAAVGGGAGEGITRDPASNRFVSGGASYTITPIVNSNLVRVVFECHAFAGPDASQTRIRPFDGCVLYKNGTVIARASLALPGGVAGSVETTLGEFNVCWSVGATFIANGGQELGNGGCTTIHV